MVRLGKHAQQREKGHFHTNKLLDAEKAEKLINIYRFYRSEKDNQYDLLKLFECLLFLQVIPISLLFVLFH